jgi:phosphoenolpyruvate carboxylase
MARVSAHKWSQEVNERSNALDLKQGVFKQKSPKRIAESLKDSADHSERRKADPYRSAMSMLTFYINRAGAQLQPEDKTKLERAKEELKKLYHRPSTGRTTAQGRKAQKLRSGR